MAKKILTGVSVLMALLFINGGLNKFLNYMPVPDGLPDELMKDTAALMEIAWLMPLVGAAEILGGLLIILPRTRALGALVLFPIMAGILLTHLTVAPDGVIMALVLWAILIWIIIDNKDKYLHLIRP
ncbi:MAG: DoxX family protein [Azospira oryzae]|nr:MAG: DoxX family protein [Azospira oryzae]